MKQRIEVKDLNQLTVLQKDNLRNLWSPARYDLVIAYVCADVEKEIYNEVEFTIGRVKIKPTGSTTLFDLRAIEGYHKLFPASPDAEGELPPEDPIVFEKTECLPLLSVGQMIEIMQKLNFSRYHFYILAGTGTSGCEVGNFNSILKTSILRDGYDKRELCDVLWEMIVSLL